MPLSPLITALDDEWARTRTSRTATAALRGWAKREPVLGRYRDLAALEAHVHDRATPGRDVDAVFAALLRTHHRADGRAGDIVLALLLPAVKRHRPTGRGASERLAVLVAQLWQAISRYPLDRRPPAIPANLLLDARRDARTATTGAASVPEVACPSLLARRLTAGDDWTDRVHDRVDLGLAALDANITTPDVALITLTRLAGWRIADLAHGTDAARLRQRRHRAEARLSAAFSGTSGEAG